MIDAFGLAVTHGLILLAFWRLLFRPDLDDADLLPPGADTLAAGADPEARDA